MPHSTAFRACVALLVALPLGSSAVHAQLPKEIKGVKVPSIPKHKDKSDTKDKSDSGDSKKSGEEATGDGAKSGSAKTGGGNVERPDACPLPNEATVAKDFVFVNAFVFSSYQKDFNVFSWAPKIKFRVNGPVPSGSLLQVEFILPTGPWVTVDCKTQEVKPGFWFDAEGGARDVPEEKGMTYTGPVDFKIHLRNELEGKDTVIFTGKFKVNKVHSNENPETTKDHMVYYVDHDWTLPIAYVYYLPDEVRGWKLPEFAAAFWVRGDPYEMDPHLFYKGKEVGKIFLDGNTEMGKSGASADVDVTPTHIPDDSLPQKGKWARVTCTMPNIKAWDKTGEKREPMPGQTGAIHMLKDNPGDYELKVLWKGKLARVIKFTVKPDGMVDSKVAADNMLGSNRWIVPIQILGEFDGKWDKDAWKTDAYYGNSLKDFAPAQ